MPKARSKKHWKRDPNLAPFWEGSLKFKNYLFGLLSWKKPDQPKHGETKNSHGHPKTNAPRILHIYRSFPAARSGTMTSAGRWERWPTCKQQILVLHLWSLNFTFYNQIHLTNQLGASNASSSGVLCFTSSAARSTLDRISDGRSEMLNNWALNNTNVIR